jgi:AbrB family looped-hinge helix DNA binding protein
MSKVTSKLQVTVPRAVADRAGIRPGDRLEWTVAGREVRVRAEGRGVAGMSRDERVARFDEATRRIAAGGRRARAGTPSGRGWTREDLYSRGRAR